MSVTFDARHISRAWLAVAVASAADKARPQLHKTVSIEEHPNGVRLVATDSVVLLHTWVPALDHDLDPPPDFDEAPIWRAVAMDPHGRARGFLAHVLKLANESASDEYAPTLEVTLRLDATSADLDEPGPALTLDGFELRYAVLELPGSERLRLRSYEGAYPNWRPVVDAFRARRTTRLGLSPAVVGRLAKAAQVFPGGTLGWTFGGAEKMARVEVFDSHPWVEGVVMPLRWDFDVDAPREDEPTAAEAATTDETGTDETATDAPSPSAEAEPPTPQPALVARFTPDEARTLHLLDELGQLTEGPTTDRDARTIARPIARTFLAARFIRRTHFDDTLRPVYELTADGKAVL